MTTYRSLAEAMEAAKAADRAERFTARQRDDERQQAKASDEDDGDRPR